MPAPGRGRGRPRRQVDSCEQPGSRPAGRGGGRPDSPSAFKIDAEECLGIRKRPGPKLPKPVAGPWDSRRLPGTARRLRPTYPDQSRAGIVDGVCERDGRIQCRHVRTGDRAGRDLRPAVVPFLVERRQGKHACAGRFRLRAAAVAPPAARQRILPPAGCSFRRLATST